MGKLELLCITWENINLYLSSGEDFHVEAAKMCDIYRNSDLTLSAACSDNDLLGFLTPRREGFQRDLPRTRTTINHKKMLQTDPIHTRAWTFQEHILPRRLLSFGTQEMFWECEEARNCECKLIDGNAKKNGSIHKIGRTAYRKYTGTVIVGRHYIGKKDAFEDYFYAFLDGATEPNLKAALSSTKGEGSALLRRGPAPTEEYDTSWQREVAAFYKYWRRTLVPEYTRRKLTKYEDRLIALQAIAVDIRSQIEDRYLGGLWENDLVNQLCWVGVNSNSVATSGDTPSWSWASISGPVEPLMSEEEEYSPLFKKMSIKKIRYEASGWYNCGRTLTGSLEVSGWLLEVTVTAKFKHDSNVVCADDGNLVFLFRADTRLSVGEDGHMKRSPLKNAVKGLEGVLSLLIIHRFPSKVIVLILGRIANDWAEFPVPKYTRLGIGEYSWVALVNACYPFKRTRCCIG